MRINNLLNNFRRIGLGPSLFLFSGIANCEGGNGGSGTVDSIFKRYHTAKTGIKTGEITDGIKAGIGSIRSEISDYFSPKGKLRIEENIGDNLNKSGKGGEASASRLNYKQIVDNLGVRDNDFNKEKGEDFNKTLGDFSGEAVYGHLIGDQSSTNSQKKKIELNNSYRGQKEEFKRKIFDNEKGSIESDKGSGDSVEKNVYNYLLGHLSVTNSEKQKLLPEKNTGEETKQASTEETSNGESEDLLKNNFLFEKEKNFIQTAVDKIEDPSKRNHSESSQNADTGEDEFSNDIEISMEEKSLNSTLNMLKAADNEKEIVNEKERNVEEKITKFLEFCEKNPFNDSDKLLKETELKNLLKDLREAIKKAKVSIYLFELNEEVVIKKYREELSITEKKMATWEQIVRIARPYSEAYGRFANLEKNYADLSKQLEKWILTKTLASKNFETFRNDLIEKANEKVPSIQNNNNLSADERFNDAITRSNQLHTQIEACILHENSMEELAQSLSDYSVIANKSIETIIKELGGISGPAAMKKMNEEIISVKEKLSKIKEELKLIKERNLDSMDSSKINSRIKLIGDSLELIGRGEEEVSDYEELVLSLKNEKEDRDLFVKLGNQQTELNTKVRQLVSSKEEKALAEAISAQQQFQETIDRVQSVWNRNKEPEEKKRRHQQMVHAMRESADAKQVLGHELAKRGLDRNITKIETNSNQGLGVWKYVAGVAAIGYAFIFFNK